MSFLQLSHVLEEPLLQLTSVGPVITVERHLLVQLACVLAASVSHLLRLNQLRNALLASSVLFMAAVRSVIWLLMHWK
jgi:hypothetical protein